MKKKFKKRLKHSFPNERKTSRPCANCDEDGSHFVPPSFGEGGFFICETSKSDKGKKNGSCNREACQAPGATWFNKIMDAYYCPSCGKDLNENNPVGKYGVTEPLCVPPTDNA